MENSIEDMKQNEKLLSNKEEEIKKLNKQLKVYKIKSEESDKLKNRISNLENDLKKLDQNLYDASNKDREIKRLSEELSLYKLKSQENESLKSKIINLESELEEMSKYERRIEEENKEVKGDIIHSMKELELITRKINRKNTRIIINLLYKASIDSDSAAMFHKKCDPAQNSIVLVETKDGKRFGGYTSCSWSGDCVEKEDPDAFIFSFDKMKTYDNIPGDDAIGCYPKFGPVFLGCQIRIFDKAFTNGGTTYEKELNFYTDEDYELTDGNKSFEVKDIEVYEVIYEDLRNKHFREDE